MKFSSVPNTSIWLSIQLWLHNCNLCQGFGLIASNPLPPAPAHILSDSAPLSRDDTIIVSQTSKFESVAQSWLEEEASADQLYSTTQSSSLIKLSSSLPSQLFTSSSTESTIILSNSDSAAAASSWTNQILKTNQYKTDKVKRVIDSSTIQLEKGGYISLESVRGAGSTFQLPDCFSYAPSHKLRQLLPKGTIVKYIQLEDVINKNSGKSPSKQSTTSSSASTPRVWIVRDKDDLLVNQELVRTGFAFVRKGTKAPPGMMEDLSQLEQTAKEKGLGIYKSCTADGAPDTSSNDGTAVQTSNFVAEFEPLDFTTEIRYGDDGGKSILVPRQTTSTEPPANPGDIKGCSDFRTYEESLGWYETYAPYYGDVAKLDRDRDGVPCPGLPHTTVGEKYRMKKPSIVKQ